MTAKKTYTIEDWKRLAWGLAYRVRVLEAERDGTPLPDPYEFTEEGFTAKQDRVMEQIRQSGPYPY